MGKMAETKKRNIKQFVYQGVCIEELVRMKTEEMIKLVPSRMRRKFKVRGLNRRTVKLYKKLRKAKKTAKVGEKPNAVKTQVRDAMITPEIVGNLLRVHDGKQYIKFEIKPEMIGLYVGEFSYPFAENRI